LFHVETAQKDCFTLETTFGKQRENGVKKRREKKARKKGAKKRREKKARKKRREKKERETRKKARRLDNLSLQLTFIKT
jgi:hypothetical protein